MNRVHGWIKVLSTWCVGLVCALAGGQAMADVNGAIFTTDVTGTIVNQNLYDTRQDVYLNGGPQNQNANGLPDGDYYFQVTDPSGAVLLSLDDISCRQLTVSGGVVIGASGACPHQNGDFNPANLSTSVQLFPFDWTPNPGGEYKAWLTPVANYGEHCAKSHEVFGFCTDDSKTDNFKVAQPATLAHITACKFSDEDQSGDLGPTEPLIPGWHITATNVEAGGNANATVTLPTAGGSPQDEGYGCVSFVVSQFALPVTLTEEHILGWTQTAPPDGGYSGYNVSGGVVTTVGLQAGDDLTIYFGNFNDSCIPITNCQENGGVIVKKDANPRFKTSWDIAKSVDKTEIDTSASSATFNYTVTVTNTGDSEWMVNGTITLSNNGLGDLTGLWVVDSIDNGGSCSVTGGTNVTVEAGAPAITLPYACTFTSNPGSGTNTVTVYDSDPVANPTATVLNQATHPYDFAGAVIVDETVNITDTLGGALGSVTYLNTPTCSAPVTCAAGAGNTATFNYSVSVPGTSGTCVTQDNTATFTSTTTNSTTTGDSNKVTVKVCVGKDLTASKTATASYDSSVKKTADQKSPVEVTGTTTLSYHVTVTESNWKVTGKITVNNPNDWESVSVNLGDSLSDVGGACTIDGGTTQTVAASSSIQPAYTCTFANAPGATSGTNTATISWDGTAAHTPDSSVSPSPTASYQFASLTVKDTFNGGTPTTLGTIAGNVASTTYTPSYQVTVPPGQCKAYPNVASIYGNPNTSEADVTVCNTNIGGLTMGFWKNPNGQSILSHANQTNLGNYLRQFHPFSDAPSSNLAGYVSGIITGATCTSSTNTCNSMLRAQMLATALDVYFSAPTSDSTDCGTVACGGNLIGAYTGLGSNQPAIGGIKIDLTKVCPKSDGGFGGACGEDASSVFGGSCKSVLAMLQYQNTSDPLADKGAAWYGQNKAKQVLAKDAFDAINNTAVVLCGP